MQKTKRKRMRKQRPTESKPRKLELFSEPIHMSGPVPVIRENIIEWFGDTKVHQHGADFRMIREGTNGLRISISAEDALWIIEELKLRVEASPMFRRAVTWCR
jgi:hypothetical protein